MTLSLKSLKKVCVVGTWVGVVGTWIGMYSKKDSLGFLKKKREEI